MDYERPKIVSLHTLGCKVNHYETEAIWQLFKEAGYNRGDFEKNADVYVINTCTVTNTGDKKSRQVIRRAVRKNPDAVICVTGCYAKRLLRKLWRYQDFISQAGHIDCENSLDSLMNSLRSVSQSMQCVTS